MKILFLTTNLPYKEDSMSVYKGWVGAFIFELKKYSQIEIAVSFFSEKVSKITNYTENGLKFYVIPAYAKPFEKVKRNLLLHDYLYSKHEHIILEVIGDFNPDIIHVFGTENPLGLITNKVNIPLVLHIQGILNPILKKWFPENYNVLNLIKTTSFKRLIMISGYFGYYLRFKKITKREINIFKTVKYFFGRTDWDKRLVSLMNNNANYFYCGEILREPFYKNEWLPQKNKDIYEIISVISPNLYKGIETILESADILQRFSSIRFSWTIAGIWGNDDLVKMIIKKTKISIEKVNIKFVGPLQVNELIEKLISSELFVHPSHIDNSPNSLCEAMLLGMPIISTSVGGIQSLITNNREGLLIQDGEPYTMAATILEMMSNTTLAIKLGGAARERALINHDPQLIIQTALNNYKDVIRIQDRQINGSAFEMF